MQGAPHLAAGRGREDSHVACRAFAKLQWYVVPQEAPMPLRDHFRSPVNDTHSWDEVHGGWPMEIVRDLKTILPAGFRAGPKVYLGSSFTDCFIAYESGSVAARVVPESGNSNTATLTSLSP